MVKVLEENREYRDNYSIRYEILNGINKGEQDESYYDNFDIGEMVKHSSNIIDLIEVGDYVNGSKLILIDYAENEFGNCDKLHFYYHFDDDEKDVNEYYEKLKIKTIVTKEQFANMEYKVEE